MEAVIHIGQESNGHLRELAEKHVDFIIHELRNFNADELKTLLRIFPRKSLSKLQVTPTMKAIWEMEQAETCPVFLNQSLRNKAWSKIHDFLIRLILRNPIYCVADEYSYN